MLALEDLKDYDETKVLEHLANSYSGKESGFSYGEINEADVTEAKEKLKNMEVLVAYESVGSWGCDSSSFFLLRDKTTNKLYEVHGSHCSCYGFEGQLNLEETEVKALKARNDKHGVFYTGGYDENEDKNKRLVFEFISALEV